MTSLLTFLGATNACLDILSAQPAAAGEYWVIVSNPLDSVVSSVATLEVTASDSVVRALGGSGFPGGAVEVPIVLESQGLEHAASSTVAFDPTVLEFVSAAKGAAASEATVVWQTDAAASGRIGVALALPEGVVMTSGLRELARLKCPTSRPTRFRWRPPAGWSPRTCARQ